MTSAILLTAFLAVPARAGAQGGGGVTTVTTGGGAPPAGGGFIAINGSPTVLPPLDPGTGAISGVVVDGASGAPLGGVTVSLSMQARATGSGAPTQRRMGQQLTDVKGRFVFTDLPASDGYLLSARRFAYFDGAFGAPPGSATGTRVFLADSDWFSQADIKLWPTGAVTGMVVDERGDPVVGAYVRVLRQLRVAGQMHLAAAAPVTTDDRGVYRIAGLDPGAYIVCVPSVQASVPTASGFSSEPAVDVDATARLVVGRYPIPPARPGVVTAYATACYPNGGPMADAAPVNIRYGADASGIDVRLQPSVAYRVSGRVEGAADARSQLTLRLLPRGSEELGQGSEAATALVAADGSFAFLNVPRGEYVLEAKGSTAQFEYSPQAGSTRTAQLPRPPTMTSGYSTSGSDITSGPPRTGLRTESSMASDAAWGRTNVSVDGHDVDGLQVVMQPAAALEGRMVFESTLGQKEPPFMLVNAESADGNPGQVRARNFRPGDPTDRLLIEGLSPGQYVLRVRGAANWVVKSVQINGRDVTRTAIEIAGRDIRDAVVTMTDQVATVNGTVRNADGTVTTSAAVVIFPVEPAAWSRYGITPDRIKSTFVDNVGGYRFTAVAAGDYFVAAVDDAQSTAWQDPAWLEFAARTATRISVSWGEKKTADLVKRAAR